MPPCPPLRGSQLFSTQFDFVPVAMVLVALVPLPVGRQAGQRAPAPPPVVPAARRSAFIAGLISVGLAIFSFIGVYDGELFWDHMVQHLLLIMVAAPLFAIASPSGAGLARHLRYTPPRRDRGVAVPGGQE